MTTKAHDFEVAPKAKVHLDFCEQLTDTRELLSRRGLKSRSCDCETGTWPIIAKQVWSFNPRTCAMHSATTAQAQTQTNMDWELVVDCSHFHREPNHCWQTLFVAVG